MDQQKTAVVFPSSSQHEQFCTTTGAGSDWYRLGNRKVLCFLDPENTEAIRWAVDSFEAVTYNGSL